MTFGEIKNLLLAQARSDAPGVTSNVGSWINLAQKRVCRELPPGGWWFTERSETIAVQSDGNFTLSATPLQVRDVILSTRKLRKIQSVDSFLFSSLSDVSAYYVSGNKVVLVPPGVVGAVGRVVYDALLDDLTQDSQSNVLLDTAPDLLIAGAMVDVSLHLGRVGDVEIWEGRYLMHLKSLVALNSRQRGRMVGDV